MDSRLTNVERDVLKVYREVVSRRNEYTESCSIVRHELEQLDIQGIQEIVNAYNTANNPSPLKG